MMPIEITVMAKEHWPAVRAIFAQGIAAGNATFETSVPSWEDWDAHHLSTCRLVALRGGEVLGWAALSAASARHVYRGVAEVSVYIAESARHQGIGSALLQAIVAESERNGLWTLQAVIHANNSVSIRTHQKAGFRLVGTRERIACLHGRWLDTVLMERRSPIVGK